MQTSFILHPIHSSSADILKRFTTGEPLTPDQLRFLEWHQRELSNSTYDPILNYYLKKRKKPLKAEFLLPHEEMNFEAIQDLKKRLKAMLLHSTHHAVVSLTQKQFLAFKQYTTHELIFWHG